MMRRGVMLAAIALLAALVLAAPAGAITYGTRDGDRHPEVGALLAPQAYSDGTWAACSGTLISPTVFLTAAHCDLEVSRVAVTFDSTYDPATGTAYWGTWHADPSYPQAQNDPHDIAVVVLDQPVTGITPARLPAAGPLDGLRGGTRFTSVGYGARSGGNTPATPWAGPPTWTTAWTPPQRGRSSASTSRFPSDRWTSPAATGSGRRPSLTSRALPGSSRPPTGTTSSASGCCPAR